MEESEKQGGAHQEQPSQTTTGSPQEPAERQAHARPQEPTDLEYLDATTVDSPGGLTEPGTAPPPNHTDVSRRCIAYWLLSILSFVVAGSFGILIWMRCAGIEVTFKDFRSLLELIITPLLTLVSAATGFYFGSQQKD